MALDRVRIAGYRSLTDVAVDLAEVTVVVGPNGSGKTNLYRAMRLLHACAEGDLARAIVGEGGLASIVQAGWRRGELVVTTHAAALADRLVDGPATAAYALEIVNGATTLVQR